MVYLDRTGMQEEPPYRQTQIKTKPIPFLMCIISTLTAKIQDGSLFDNYIKITFLKNIN